MLKNIQEILLRALIQVDPMEALRKEIEKAPQEDRIELEKLTEDGIHLSQLLIQKLRFEKICWGAPEIEEWYQNNPDLFTNAFQSYSDEVPHKEWMPTKERENFIAYCRQKGFLPPQ
jgi:hypothetical protein